LLLNPQEVEWVEADDYYAAVHARNCRYLIRESLSSLELRLDQKMFLRTHRSAIVNINFISEVRHVKGEIVLILKTGTRVPVSRRRHTRISRLLSELRRGIGPPGNY
jgi:DNA-binding LytR/AlgR family response regulator